MPLFEYVCKKCCEISEQLVTGARKPVCPNCGSTHLEKQLSSFSTPVSASRSLSPPPCGSGSCPARGMGCAGGGCPHAH